MLIISFVERTANNNGLRRATSDIDLKGCSWLSQGCRNVAKCDAGAEGRGAGAAGDLSDCLTVGDNGAVWARDAASDGHADEALSEAILALLAHGIAADEVVSAQLRAPAKRRLERSGGLIHVVSVQVEAGLQAQRVTGTQPDGGNAVGLARRQDRRPDRSRFSGGDEDLEAVLAGISGSSNDAACNASDGGLREPEVLDR